MSPNFLRIAVALPLLAICLGIARAELTVQRSRDFVFEIEGFDPRDLLRGHYLQFRLRVEPLATREPCDDATRGRCCLCLTRAADDAVSSLERASCETARSSCDGALDARYVTETLRYYVPEEQASKLEKTLIEAAQRRGAHVVLAVDANGEANVRELRIDGEPIPGGIAR